MSDEGCADGYETCDCCDGTGAVINADDGLYYDCKPCTGAGVVHHDCGRWPCDCRTNARAEP